MSAIPFEVLDEESRPPIPPTAPVGPGLTPAPAATAAPPKIDTLPPPSDVPAKQRLTLPWKGGRSSPRMSMGMVIGVSAVTATVVVLGLYFFLRTTATNGPIVNGSAAASAPSAPTAAAPATSTTPRTSGTARPRPTASTAPTPAAPPQTSAPAPTSAPVTTSAPAPTSAPGSEPSAADLPLGYGYLVVDNGAPADVYISGRPVGPTSQPLKVMCGRWFARLATPGGGKSPEWVSPGMTVTVPCQGLTRVDFRVAKPTKKH